MRLSLWIVALLFVAAVVLLYQLKVNSDVKNCGQVVTVATHDSSTTDYTLAAAKSTQSPITMLLIVGGGGFVDLDEMGCPRNLNHNPLVRIIPMLQKHGISTALLDATSGYEGDDGFAGFRTAPDHGVDLGKVVEDIRMRTHGAVWIVGDSRGAISAVNAASRLVGPSAPDGLILCSPVTVGSQGIKKQWFTQNVFDLDVEKIHVPTLIVSHDADSCERSPPSKVQTLIDKLGSTHKQIKMFHGGDLQPESSTDPCTSSGPHGFVGLDSELADFISRWVSDTDISRD